MIRHFGIFPAGFDKENLFEEQKIFLIYLMGIIPDMDTWKINIDYKLELKEIYSLKHVEISDTEKDLAVFQGKSLSQIYSDKLKNEKKNRINELNKKYKIEQSKEETSGQVQKDVPLNYNPVKLWDILQGKGILNKDAGI